MANKTLLARLKELRRHADGVDNEVGQMNADIRAYLRDKPTLVGVKKLERCINRSNSLECELNEVHDLLCQYIKKGGME